MSQEIVITDFPYIDDIQEDIRVVKETLIKVEKILSVLTERQKLIITAICIR